MYGLIMYDAADRGEHEQLCQPEYCTSHKDMQRQALVFLLCSRYLISKITGVMSRNLSCNFLHYYDHLVERMSYLQVSWETN